MAASRVLSRLSSRSPSLSPKLHKNTVSPPLSPLKSSSQSDPARCISRFARLPLALTSLMSMMPLHNAVASARLTSALSIDSQSWGLIPQGISMPL